MKLLIDICREIAMKDLGLAYDTLPAEQIKLNILTEASELYCKQYKDRVKELEDQIWKYLNDEGV